MPYFLYRISPERKLTLLETFEKFQEAKGVARRLRAEQPAGDAHVIRMIFAENPKKAQLCSPICATPRPTATTDAGPPGRGRARTSPSRVPALLCYDGRIRHMPRPARIHASPARGRFGMHGVRRPPARRHAGCSGTSAPGEPRC